MPEPHRPSLPPLSAYAPKIPSIIHNLDAARFVVRRDPGLFRIAASVLPSFAFWVVNAAIIGVIVAIAAWVFPTVEPPMRVLAIVLGGFAVGIGLCGTLLLPLMSQCMQRRRGDLIRVERASGTIHLPRLNVTVPLAAAVRVALVRYAAVGPRGGTTYHLSDLVLCVRGPDGAEACHVILKGASGSKGALGKELAGELAVPFESPYVGAFRQSM